MIKKLIISNFQSHKYTELEFDKGVNIVIGTSDSGKSAICRALNWVVFNRPLGNDFRSDWGGDTFVEIHLSDGNMVRRVKTNSDNMYVVNGKELRALKSDVPEEVVKILNMDELNFHNQLSGPYLLNNTSGDVARQLNKIVNLDVVDRSLSNALSSIRSTNQELEREKIFCKEKEDEYESYGYIIELDEECKQLEFVESDLNCIVEQQKQLDIIIENYVHINSKLSKLDYVDNCWELVNELESQRQHLVSSKKSHDILVDVIDSVERVSILLNDMKKYDRVSGDFLMIQKIQDQYMKSFKLHDVLTSLIASMINVQTQMFRVDGELRRYEDEWQELMPEICPLCGQGVK